MMQTLDLPRTLARFARRCRASWIALALLSLAGSGCVTENTTTGEMVPRGNQRYPFDKVEDKAKGLVVGMSKEQVLYLLGSPAEIDKENDLWIYLPERYAIIVPARALRLEFKNGLLAEHGYRAIVLGTRL